MILTRKNTKAVFLIVLDSNNTLKKKKKKLKYVTKEIFT
jgi:hypothetical protein